jgi:hypothetical protein
MCVLCLLRQAMARLSPSVTAECYRCLAGIFKLAVHMNQCLLCAGVSSAFVVSINMHCTTLSNKYGTKNIGVAS